MLVAVYDDGGDDDNDHDDHDALTTFALHRRHEVALDAVVDRVNILQTRSRCEV